MKQPKYTLTYLRQKGSDWVSTFRKVLQQHGKKATGFTANSIRYETHLKGTQVENELYADESLEHIEHGRPAGSKMPPSIFSRQGRQLNLWFGARGIPRNKSTDFLIRRSIAKKGIELTPVIEESIEAIEKINKAELEQVVKQDLEEMGYFMFREAIN